MLTVTCVLVKGPVAYTPEYVVRLRRMVARYLPEKFQFVCLTDDPGALPDDVDVLAIPPTHLAVPENGRGYWAKVQLFNRANGFTGRVLFLDLDVLVVGDLKPIVDAPTSLALCDDPFAGVEGERDRYGRQVIRAFNSSVMAWDAGTCDALYDDWRVDVTQRLSTDQDWIAEQRPDAIALPLAWFPRLSQVQPPWPEEARVVLCKKPKPHEAVTRFHWFDAQWGGWA